MSTKLMDGALYANMIKSGAAELSDNIKLVNDLNVFPIPDGDTGDNMFMTIDSGAAHLTDESETSIFKIADRAAGGMLLAQGATPALFFREFSQVSPRDLRTRTALTFRCFQRRWKAESKRLTERFPYPLRHNPHGLQGRRALRQQPRYKRQQL